MVPYKHFKTLLLTGITLIFALQGQLVRGQERFADKLFPRSNSWSVKCDIYRLTETHVIALFPGHDNPSEIARTSLKKIEYGDQRQVFFNEHGQIEAEITVPLPALVTTVNNIGLLTLADGREVVLNGIDFALPSDSLSLHHFGKGAEFVRSMIQGKNVSLQFDLVRNDEFGRIRAYVILADGRQLNLELIKRGFCKADRGKPLIYMEDFIAMEDEARRNKRGIWSGQQ